MHSSKRNLMLVHLVVVLLHIVAFCDGKSLRYRGKRSYYNQGVDTMAQNNYYYPQVDGQPIYVPSIDHSAGHMNKLLEEYYGRYPAYTQAWAPPTAAPYNYDNVESNYYESPVTSNSMVKTFLGDTDDDGHRGDYHILPPKSQMKNKPDMSEDNNKYLAYEDLQKTKLPDSDESLIYEKAKVKKQDGKSDVPKMDPNLESYDVYEPPIVRDKINVKKHGDKTVISKIEPKPENKDDYYEDTVEQDRVKVKKGAVKTESKAEKEDDYYEDPVVQDRVKVKKGDVKTESKSEKEDDYYEDPVVHDRVKVKKGDINSESKSEEEDDYYEDPVVYDKINVQKDSKTTIPKSEPKLEQKDKDYEQLIVRDRANVKKYEDEILEKKEPPLEKEILKEEKVVKKQGKEVKDSYDSKITKGNKKSNRRRKQHKKYEAVKENSNEMNEKTDELYPDEVLTETKNKPVMKSEQKNSGKTEQKEAPIKIKEKVVIKTKPKETLVKEKVVIKTKPKETVVKEKVVIKTKPIKTPVKDKVEKINFEPEDAVNKLPVEELKADSVEDFDSEEDPFSGSEFQDINDENIPDRPLKEEEKSDQEAENNPTFGGNPMNIPKFLPNEAVNRLSSLNANIWSLIFNPNAEGLKVKKCLTRTNETGFCTYVQNCEVPDIAASLEQLLNNACVIDDIFIGVCCPEFPVQTVKVHWEDEISNAGKQSETEFVENVDDCGIRSNEASKQQSWPWKAPLVSMSNGKIFCGGVIISDNYVLTAAHCTTKIPRNQILVRLGQFDDSTGDDFAVVEIKRHAQYNPRTLHNDIALLKLGRRIMRDEHTGIICLPDDDDDEDEHEGEKATLLGWKGMFGKNSKKTELLEVMEKEECKKKLRTNVPKTVLCTEARNEDERTCNADSGAPLVIEDDGKYEVIGILSWNRNDCDQRFPSTFSRVSRYVGWIRKHAV